MTKRAVLALCACACLCCVQSVFPVNISWFGMPLPYIFRADIRKSAATPREQAMRLVWNQRGVRMYFFAAAAFDSPGTAIVDNAYAYLMQNAADIGAVFARYRGKKAGDEIASLLQQQTVSFGALVDALKNARTAVSSARRAPAMPTMQYERWNTASDELAAFFGTLFPTEDPQRIMYMMREISAVMYDQVVERQRGRIESQADIHLDLVVMLRDLADYFSQKLAADVHD